jgi:hypothetical protein
MMKLSRGHIWPFRGEISLWGISEVGIPEIETNYLRTPRIQGPK